MVLGVLTDEASQKKIGELGLARLRIIDRFSEIGTTHPGTDFVIVDCKTMLGFPKLAKDFFSKKKFKRVALLSWQSSDQNLVFLESFPFLTDVLIADSVDLEKQLALVLTPTSDQFEKPYFRLKSVKWQTEFTTMSESSFRHQCYADIDNFVATLNCFNDFASIVQTAASELLTNAFYDAPRDTVADQALHPDRAKDIKLEHPNHVGFSFGIDQKHLWIATTDSYGSLTRDKIVSSLSRVNQERSAIIDKPGGAGLGLFMLYNWASSVYYVIRPNNQTSVFIKLLLTRRQLSFEREQCSFHFCEVDGRDEKLRIPK